MKLYTQTIIMEVRCDYNSSLLRWLIEYNSRTYVHIYDIQYALSFAIYLFLAPFSLPDLSVFLLVLSLIIGFDTSHSVTINYFWKPRDLLRNMQYDGDLTNN